MRKPRLPALTKLSESSAAIQWKAQFPSSLTKQGGCYRVTTYPNSDLVFVQTWVNRRIVNGAAIKQAIRAALEALPKQTAPAHLSAAPEGAQLAGWHPTEDCFAAIMPDGSARLYINGREIEDDAPLHTVSDLSRMDQDEYRATIERIESGQVSLRGKQDDSSS